MHMNSAPHLRPEDRPEFERVLDDALRTAPGRPGFDGLGQRLSAEELRAMALAAAAAIAACAAAEYRHLTAVREELRRASASAGPAGEADGGESPGPGQPGSSGAPGTSKGAGLLATLSVLTPVLAGAAAVIFLAVGYLLTGLSPDLAIGRPMRNVGWAFAGLAAAGLLAASVSLVLTALRNSAVPPRPGTPPGTAALGEELARARAAWRRALLERGFLPFLREALAGQGGPRPGRASPTPRLGYSHPGFTSPAATPEEARTPPRYSSPDFTGPGHAPE
ncbi:hypothetical protein V1J52_17610 [Streptomyces sp. TRM 70351]|uniref:hypothetical protein n=1 Tax=Streptomyces sp. TRM 70351 TaxID=3116552 RepID=UPI002E7C3366|nr:hypothetical protein [Streptomyces sp. TRM 70351]MEE1929979.1 hypothetical protein [Streptomyces sp. TRM 70351]